MRVDTSPCVLPALPRAPLSLARICAFYDGVREYAHPSWRGQALAWPSHQDAAITESSALPQAPLAAWCLPERVQAPAYAHCGQWQTLERLACGIACVLEPGWIEPAFAHEPALALALKQAVPLLLEQPASLEALWPAMHQARARLQAEQAAQQAIGKAMPPARLGGGAGQAASAGEIREGLTTSSAVAVGCAIILACYRTLDPGLASRLQCRLPRDAVLACVALPEPLRPEPGHAVSLSERIWRWGLRACFW